MHQNRVCGIFIQDVMDTNSLAVLKLLLVGILVNSWMTRGLSATENINVESIPRRPSVALCNETQLLSEMEVCGEGFKREMAYVDPQNWCNLTHFISVYHVFSLCTETNAGRINCYWPNPLVESYIIRIHKHFFSNCTLERVILVDPPDDTLTILILIPVFLTLAMIALVVWCSKRSDILA
ncbi:receptor activity-modifying protein 3-like isoform X1 [Salvelinus namaycush]|uniref:Receptor activity-modifying protein 3 n=1 Tax=Salvelinus namaycush TaxID=8040 RepID=A0A8U0R0G4_SALNM|nr:receptor activity-modifying protein 3-like isoform X1 [Salvelinus namaycush]